MTNHNCPDSFLHYTRYSPVVPVRQMVEAEWADWPPRALEGVDQRPWVNAVLAACRYDYDRRRKAERASEWRAL